jgi:hypothetical protein
MTGVASREVAKFNLLPRTQKCAPIRNLGLQPKLLCRTVDSLKGMVLQTVDSQ